MCIIRMTPTSKTFDFSSSARGATKYASQIGSLDGIMQFKGSFLVVVVPFRII